MENAADVLELLSFGRDRKSYVNMIIRVCTLYCDILSCKIFADEVECFVRCHQAHGTLFKNIAEAKFLILFLHVCSRTQSERVAGLCYFR